MAAHEMSGQVFAIIKLDLPVVIMVLEDFLWEQYCQSWTRMLQAFGLFQVRCHSGTGGAWVSPDFGLLYAC